MVPLPYLVFVFHPGFAAAFVLLVASGLGAAYSLGFSALVLQATDDGVRARTLAINSSGLMFLQGLGFAAAGAVAEFVDPHVTIAAAGVTGLVVVAFSGRIRPEKQHNPSSARRSREQLALQEATRAS